MRGVIWLRFGGLTVYFLSFVTLVASGHRALASLPPAQNTVVLCKNNKIVRTIQISQGSDGQCTTTYTKAGVDREVGNGRNRVSCERVLSNIKDNLEKAAWQCRDVSQAMADNK